MEGQVLKRKKKTVTITKRVKNIAIASCSNKINIRIKANLSWAITIDNELDIIDKAKPTVIAKEYILTNIE